MFDKIKALFTKKEAKPLTLVATAAPLWLPGATRVGAWKDSGVLTGNAKKVVWHTTENDPTKVSATTIANYLNKVGSQVHIIWNPVTGEIVQMIPANKGGRGLVNAAGGVDTNTSGAIVVQIEVVGQATKPFTDGPMKNLDKIIVWLRALGVPDVWPAGDLKPYPASYGGVRSTSAWAQSGHFGHSQVPENDHGDPGNIDQNKILECCKPIVPAPAPKPVPTPKPAPVISAADKVRVMTLQTVLHQTADGAFGPATIRALNAVLDRKRESVAYVQRVVGTNPDGVWGPKSEAARIACIKAVQRMLGVTADGAWGPKTAAAWLAFKNRTYMKY